MIEIEMGNRGSKSDRGVYRKYIYGVCKRATSRWFFSCAI